MESRITNLIIKAGQARLEAERTNDPELYKRAANYFEMCGLSQAASRMYDRAEHYRKLAKDAALS